VPFGVVRRTLTNKDQSGKVVWSMEQDLTDFGMTPKATTAAKPVAPKAPAPGKKPATKKKP
jgi:hypothetical protein